MAARTFPPPRRAQKSLTLWVKYASLQWRGFPMCSRVPGGVNQVARGGATVCHSREPQGSGGGPYYSKKSKAGMLCYFNELQFSIARQSWYVIENKGCVEKLGKAGM